jgi:hypothetical protein
MSEATDLIDRQISAFRDRDLESFLNCYAQDVKIGDFSRNIMMDGLEAVRGVYGQMFKDSPGDLKVEISNRIAVGDYVIDEEIISSMIEPGIPPGFHGPVIYVVRDGLIQEVAILM